MPKTKVAKTHVSQTELLELYLKVQKAGGTMVDMCNEYRTMSGSVATDQSIKSSVSNRISELRQEAENQGFSKEQTLKLIPKFVGGNKKAENNSSAISTLFGDQLAELLGKEDETTQEED